MDEIVKDVLEKNPEWLLTTLCERPSLVRNFLQRQFLQHPNEMVELLDSLGIHVKLEDAESFHYDATSSLEDIDEDEIQRCMNRSQDEMTPLPTLEHVALDEGRDEVDNVEDSDYASASNSAALEGPPMHEESVNEQPAAPVSAAAAFDQIEDLD